MNIIYWVAKDGVAHECHSLRQVEALGLYDAMIRYDKDAVTHSELMELVGAEFDRVAAESLSRKEKH